MFHLLSLHPIVLVKSSIVIFLLRREKLIPGGLVLRETRLEWGVMELITS
jgi:hypothetical protein